MRDVEQTPLPGTGVRHDFRAADGRRVGVLLHRSGRRELVVYARDDPDACVASVDLDPDDVATLVELLGGSQVSEAVGSSARQPIRGLGIDWIAVGSASACAGASLREADVRGRTGVSVVAVIRDDETVPSPPPEFVLEVGDTVVAVGTDEGLRALGDLLAGRPA